MVGRAQALHPSRALTSRGIVATTIAMILAIIIITPHRLGQWFNELAVWIRDLGPAGMAICCCMVGKSSTCTEECQAQHQSLHRIHRSLGFRRA